jgi:hypothetical protein
MIKKTLGLMLFIILFAVPAFGQSKFGTITAQSTDCSVASSCVTLNLSQAAGGATITLTGTWSATLNFEVSGDNGVTYTAASTASATANGVTNISVAGYTNLRVRCNPFTSGTVNVTLYSGAGSIRSSSSPSSLTNFFNKSYGLAPDDFGAKGDLKWCYDGTISGQPTTTFTSKSANKSLTTTSLTSNIASYVFTNTNPTITAGQLVTVTGSTHNAVFNVTNATVLSATSTGFTVAITNANIGSAADAGTIANTQGCALFTAADVGKTIEIKGVGAAGAILSTTIASFVDANTITLAASATTNAAAQKFWYATDSTTALQNWVNAINLGVPTATGLQVHAGYLAGMYATTKPLKFINPLSVIDTAGGGAGYGTPEPFTNLNADESLQIWGTGAYRSGFVALTGFNWSFPDTSSNTAVFYYKGWNGPNFQNFSVLSPDQTVAFNTTANTGIVCGMAQDTNAHEYTNGIEVENFHNTTSTLPGDCIIGTGFESMHTNSQFYNNDYNGYYGKSTTGSGVNTFDHVNFANVTWEGANGATGPGACNGQVIFDGDTASPSGSYSQVRITNSKITDNGTGVTTNATVCITGTATNTNVNEDGLIFENTDIIASGGTSPGFVIKSANTGIRITFTNVRLRNTAGGASAILIVDSSNNAQINMFGGSLDCGTACTGGWQAGSNAQTAFIYGATNASNNVGFGASVVYSFIPAFGATGGWSGKGQIQGTGIFSNQGTACTNGELALSAGWQSTGAATVTAAAGVNQTCSWTITTGTTTAANPTVTDTLVNPIPAATIVCEMNIYGGTHTAVAGESLRQTTLSATAPVFTANFTPTAGGLTYFVLRRCGP